MPFVGCLRRAMETMWQNSIFWVIFNTDFGKSGRIEVLGFFYKYFYERLFADILSGVFHGCLGFFSDGFV